MMRKSPEQKYVPLKDNESREGNWTESLGIDERLRGRKVGGGRGERDEKGQRMEKQANKDASSS